MDSLTSWKIRFRRMTRSLIGTEPASQTPNGCLSTGLMGRHACNTISQDFISAYSDINYNLSPNTHIDNHKTSTKKCFGLVRVILVENVSSLPRRLIEMCSKNGRLVDYFLRILLEVIDVEGAVADTGGVIKYKDLWSASAIAI
jgi:hypothetical protein